MAKETYEDFVEKFKPKLTTDDCYTPPQLMADIVAYFVKRFNITEEIIQPFYPGGDYESEDYTNKVVIDNPPFSLMSKILKFYREHNVRAVLFCPGLTSPAEQLEYWTTIVTSKGIIYENGANVATNFVHNFTPDTVIEVDSELTSIIIKHYPNKKKPKTKRQPTEMTTADFRTLSRIKTFKVKREDVKAIDSKIYGRGLVLTPAKYKELQED